jgi:hypothetical protein
MIEYYGRGNKDFQYRFDEKATWEGCMRAVQNAFVDGCTCFGFFLAVKGRKFQEGFALRPEIHDEKAAVEMAHEVWLKFQNTIQMVLDPEGYAKAMAEFQTDSRGPAQ